VSFDSLVEGTLPVEDADTELQQQTQQQQQQLQQQQQQQQQDSNQAPAEFLPSQQVHENSAAIHVFEPLSPPPARADAAQSSVHHTVVAAHAVALEDAEEGALNQDQLQVIVRQVRCHLHQFHRRPHHSFLRHRRHAVCRAWKKRGS
jgi:hypothetical protein